MLTLYTTIIRPILEYGAIVWYPHNKCDINALEKTQKRCLALCNHPPLVDSLESRRRTTDLVETYKFTSNKYKTDSTTFFSEPHRLLRGHSKKLHKVNCHTETRKNFFSMRIINSWNKLSETTVSAPSIGTFKKRLRAAPRE